VDEKRREKLSGGGAPQESSAPAPDQPSSPFAEEQEQQVERDFGELLANVERQRDEYLDLAKRTKADFDNYRKRVAGEAADAENRGRADVVRQLLPVLDNLERALKASDPQDDEAATGHLAEGVRLVYEELEGVLRRSGVESYEPAGEPFDPQWHEAMMTRPVPADQTGKVLEVLEKGYRQDGQVLRPARVVVGKEPEAAGDEA
jgi:molecular chaperone GrpE